MPTRVVWDTTQSPGKRGHAPASSPPRLRHSPAFFPDALMDPTRRADSFDRATSEATLSSRKHKRSIPVGFRSSLLRDQLQVDKPSGGIDGDDDDDEVEEEMVRLSSDDIRASPRLLGYLFSVVAGAVQLISVYLFYREEISGVEQPQSTTPDDSGILFDEKYYVTSFGLVFRWKLWAAIYQSVAAVGLCLLTVVVHFDTIAFPNFWMRFFRDGSPAERNWILLLILVWVVGLHVATSVLSVGEYQANVFFTSWIGFGTMALNYGVWRESAGLRSWAERINSYHRETTYNWIWTGICSCIFAGSATDMYYNSEYVELRFRGERLDLNREDWLLILSIIWTEVAVCILAVIFNETFRDSSWKCPCRLKRRDGVYRLVFGWRQFEGLIILAAMGAKFWAILEYTGFGGVINGLSNAYFGIWGSFFNSVFALGSWLRENKNLETIVHEPMAEEESAERAPPRRLNV